MNELQLPSGGGTTRLAISPSLIRADEFLEHGLLDGAVLLPMKQRLEFQALWRRLKAEDAPLRIFEGDKLVSAPLDAFDHLILQKVGGDWRKMARVVGDVLGDWMDDYRQQGDILLASRARALAEAGAIEWRGDLYDIRNCEVRRP